MKKYTIALTLTLLGMVGCKNNKVMEVKSMEKIDTALVLGKLHSCDQLHDIKRFLLVNKNGVVVTTTKSALSSSPIETYEFSNVGDTVIIATDNLSNVKIVKNLTMENKIKAFTR